MRISRSAANASAGASSRPWGLIKKAAALTNLELGLLNREFAEAIAAAAGEVAEGRWDGEFVLDVYQTGSGTSTNMNTNEVVARRANQMLEGRGGSVHPNDHVNFGQSSNDTIPSAMHISARVALERELIPALVCLRDALAAKAKAFDHVIKSGRTHLMDATPVRLGQQFGGYASQLAKGIERVRAASAGLAELALGGTAVGTGINTHPDFAGQTIARVSGELSLEFVEAENHFEAQASKDAVVYAAGALNTVATSFIKIADDIRWLASGPTSGLAEIRIPAVQPGSSIMPGKSESCDGRGYDDGCRPCHGEPHDGDRRWAARKLRAKRHDAGHGACSAGVHYSPLEHG